MVKRWNLCLFLVIFENANHMIKHTTIKILGLFLVIATWTTTVAQIQSGADGYLYSPQYGNFDNFNDAGDLSVQISAGALAKSLLPGLRIAYSPISNFGLGVNYFSFNSSSSQFDPQQSNTEIVSGDVFYYKLMKETDKLKVNWRLGIGYGAGKVSRQYGSNFRGQAKLGIQKYLIETGLLLSKKNVGFGLGLRGKYYNFSNREGFGDIDRRELEKLDYLINVAPAFLIDLNTRLEFGGELGRLFFSLDTTLNNFKNENNLISSLIDRESIHLGFYLLINKAINKKNIEK